MVTTEIGTRRRARTDSQKEARRQAILEGARAHFRVAGFEQFSMAALARDVGIAKGTLYLYFATREEVLLAVFIEELRAFADRLLPDLVSGIGDAYFCDHFYQASVSDPVFLGLAGRLESVIEHNVSVDAFIDLKRAMAAELERMSAALSGALDITVEQGFDLLVSLSVLLQGASQVDAGPMMAGESLPADVEALMANFSAEDIFQRNALRILSGIRTQ